MAVTSWESHTQVDTSFLGGDGAVRLTEFARTGRARPYLKAQLSD
ncbi:hypothetical protein ACLVWQ_06920 [Streptomyces sp. CWNU-52B]